MGNKELNYDIKYEKISDNEVSARIKHLKMQHEEIFLQSFSIEGLKRYVHNEIAILDEIYTFNINQKHKINRILTIEKKEAVFDWSLFEKKELFPYKIFSTEHIQYNLISGKPEAYFQIDSPKQSTRKSPIKPSPPFNLPILKEARQKKYEEKMLTYNKDVKTYKQLDKEQREWKSQYPKIIKQFKKDYQARSKKSIEIYSKLVLNILEFNINFAKEYSLKYDLENKYLTVNYSIKLSNDIVNLLKEKVYNKVELIQVNDEELIKRLNHIWSQVILKIIYELYKADEINSIKSIYFNGKILDNNELFKFGKEQYKTQIIVSKEQFEDTFLKDKKIYTSERIKEFNRDLFFIRELQYEGIYLSNNQRNSSYYELSYGNIIAITIDGNKLLTSKIFKIMANFSELKKLYILNNSFVENIPLELFNLITLEEISFSHTQIKDIPNEIVKLKNIKLINFSYNKILEITQKITILTQLDKLDLNGNQIKDISLDILNSLLDMKLSYFSLFNNPILIDTYGLSNEELIVKLIGDKKKVDITKNIISRKPKKRVVSTSLKLDTRPLIITEGKTDWKHFKSALNFFNDNGEFENLTIEFHEYNNIDMGDTKLEKRLKDDAEIPQDRMRIGIFDCDTKIGKKYEDRNNQKLAKNVYAISIPTPSFRKYHTGICVEFLYQDEDLKKKDSFHRRIFLSDEFSNKGRLLENREITIENSSKIKKYTDKKNSKIVDSEVIDIHDNNIALSKNDFATNILEKVAPFNKMDFEGFRGLFELLEEIIPNKKVLETSEFLESTIKTDKNIFDYTKLRDDLIEISLLETKNRNAISKESEDETNDRFRNALSNRKYNVTDQSRGGESSSGINAGERDLVVCNTQGIDESIIEALQIKEYNNGKIESWSQKLKTHYTKLVERYDTVGNEVNFLLVYSKVKNFDDLWKKYVDYDEFDNFVDTKDEYSQKDNVRVGISEYGKMKVYHLFINFYSHGGD